MFSKPRQDKNELDEKSLEWAVTRQQGMFFFVLTHGVIYAILIDVLGSLLADSWIHFHKADLFHLLSLDSIVGVLFVGIIESLREWNSGEKHYGEMQEKRKALGMSSCDAL